MDLQLIGQYEPAGNLTGDTIPVVPVIPVVRGTRPLNDEGKMRNHKYYLLLAWLP